MLFLLLTALASAQSLGNTPYFAQTDLRTCFNEGGPACDSAATALGGPWAKVLPAYAAVNRPQVGDDLEAALLGCAVRGRGCEAAADALNAPNTRMESALLLLESCRQGEASRERCAAIGTEPFSSRSFITPLVSQQEAWRIVPGRVPAQAVTAQLLATCDGASDTSADACLTLAGVTSAMRMDPHRFPTFLTTLEQACAAGSYAACNLVSSFAEPDAPMHPALDDLSDLLILACGQGASGEACEAAARTLELGRSSALGSWGSRQLHGYACDGGEKEGCTALDTAYTTPYLASVIEQTCDKAKNKRGGDPRACTEHSAMLRFGVGLEKDEARAAALAVDACNAGDPRPCTWRGNDLWAEQPKAAADWYRKGCAHGDGVSCGVVGRMTLLGESGVPQSNSGIDDMRRGCRLGAGNACFELGFSYSKGRGGLIPDSAEATKYYSQACSLAYPNGCSSLGVMLHDGRGIAQSRAQSTYLLARSCELGHASACMNLGNGYAKMEWDSSTEPDLPRARAAYGRGCELGHEASCDALTAIGPEGERQAPETGTAPPVFHAARPSHRARRTISVGSFQVEAAPVPEEVTTERTRRNLRHRVPMASGFISRDLGSSGLGHDGSYGLALSTGFQGFQWGLQLLREDWGFGTLDSVELSIERGFYTLRIVDYRVSVSLSAYVSGGYSIATSTPGASIGGTATLNLNVIGQTHLELFWRPVKPFAYGNGTVDADYLQAVRQDIGVGIRF